MKFVNKTPITVKQFHYDLNEQPAVITEVNVGIEQVVQEQQDGSRDEGKDGKYFEISVPFKVSPEPGFFTVSGLITRIVQFKDYFGDGQDLTPEDYQLLSRPLVEKIETLTYRLTQLTLGEAVNLSFEADFDDSDENKN